MHFVSAERFGTGHGGEAGVDPFAEYAIVEAAVVSADSAPAVMVVAILATASTIDDRSLPRLSVLLIATPFAVCAS